MDKRAKIILYTLAAVLLGLFIIESSRPRPINWRASYTSGDKIPLGAYVLYDNLDEIFSDSRIESVDQVPIEFLRNHEKDSTATYFFLNDYLNFDKTETEYLLDFAERGNKVFISSSYVYGPLADTLNLKTSSSSFYPAGEDTLRTRLVNPAFQDRSYVYHRAGAYRYFESYDTLRTKILGEVLSFNPNSNYFETLFADDRSAEELDSIIAQNPTGFEATQAAELKTRKTPQVNYIEVSVGKGSFYINLNPVAYSNYYMLNGKHQYVTESLSYLDNEVIYFDEYGKSGRKVVTSPMRFVLSTPALSWAYYLAVTALLLYMIFVSKREQRILPVVEPLKNDTIDFTKTIGNLYYQSGDYTSIVDKKILFFLERLRSTYYLDTEQLNEAFIKKLSVKAAVPLQETRELIELINKLRLQPLHNQYELQELNKRIEAFLKK